MDVSAPACATDAGSVCAWVWSNTGLEFLARHADGLLSSGTHILVIVLVAMGLRWLSYRVIGRVARLTAEGTPPAMLRPLRQMPLGNRIARGVSAERRRQRSLAVGSLLRSVVSFLIIGTAVVLILAEFGINVGPLLASAGIVGVAVAFGAQNLIKDFLSGVFLTLEDQFGVGDTVDLGPASGVVTEVGLRTTTVRAGDGTIWHVRNGEILRVGNASQGEAVVSVDLVMPYDADTAKATQIAQERADDVADDTEWADKVVERPRVVGIAAVGPGTVTLRVTATVRSGDQDPFARALRAAIRAGFDAARAQDPAWDFRPPNPSAERGMMDR